MRYCDVKSADHRPCGFGETARAVHCPARALANGIHDLMRRSSGSPPTRTEACSLHESAIESASTRSSDAYKEMFRAVASIDYSRTR